MKRLCYAQAFHLQRAACTLILGVGLTGCGYQPVYGRAPEQALCVRAAAPRVPDFGAVAAALAGARSELARAGALKSGTLSPCLIIEVLRVQEVPTGISSPPSAPDVPPPFVATRPRARGSSVSVTGRGWVEYTAGTVRRDTGDLNRVARVATGSALPDDAAVHRAATRAAADNLGRGIARRVLGLPVPPSELP